MQKQKKSKTSVLDYIPNTPGLQDILDSLSEPVFCLDTDYCYTGFNRNYIATVKAIYDTDITVGSSMLDVLSIEEDRERAKSNVDRALQGETVTDEVYFGAAKGSKLYVEITHSPLRNAENKITGVVVYAKNITKRKCIEEDLATRERQFRHVFENSTIGVSLTKIDGTLRVNHAFSQLLGYSEEELQTKKWQDISHPDDIQKTKDAIAGLLRGESSSYRLEKRYLHKNGSVVWADVNTTLEKDRKGNPQHFITSVNDITERKQAEIALLAKEELFRKVFDEAPFGMVSVNMNFYIHLANKKFCSMLGYTQDELRTMSFADITHPDHREPDVQNVKMLLDGEISHYQTVKRYICKNSDVIWGSVNVSVLSNSTGVPLQLIAVIEDITAQKRAEEEIKKINERLHLAQKASKAGTWDWNIVQNSYYWSAEFLDLFGMDSATNPGFEAWKNRVHPEDYAKAVENIQNTIHEKKELLNDYRIILPNQETRWIRATGTTFYDNEKPVRMAGLCIDITDQKKSELALRESEEQFRILAEHSPNMIFINVTGRVVYANSKCEEITGYSKQEFYSPDFNFLQLIAPESVPIVRKNYEEHTKGKNVPPYEYTIICKDGNRIEAINSSTLIRYEGKNAIMGVITDITERKRSEETLKRLNQAIQSSQDIILMADLNGIITFINPAFTRTYGYEPGEIVGKMTPRVLESGLEDSPVHEEFWKILMAKQTYTAEFHNKTKSGQIIPIEMSATPITDLSGSVCGFLCIERDISERYRSDERARKEALRTKLLLDLYETASSLTEMQLYNFVLDKAVELTGSKIGFLHIISDDQSTIHLTTWNQEALNNCTAVHDTHYPINQAGNWADCVRLREPVIYNDFKNSANQKGLPSGHTELKRFMSIPVVDEGKVRLIFGVGNKEHDYDEYDSTQIQVIANELYKIITRRLLDTTLRENETKFRAIFEQSVDAIGVYRHGLHAFVNPSYLSLFGYSSESELNGKLIFDLIAPEERERVLEKARLCEENNKVALRFETHGMKKNGSEFDLDVHFSTYTLDSETYTLALLRDITEQNRREKERNDLEQQLIQSQKLESIGTLAGGIAHDFNNILSIILGHCSLLQMGTPSRETTTESLHVITTAVQRGTDLVKQILTFARRSEIAVGPLNINTMVKEHVKMLSETFPKIIAIELELDKSIPSIIADPTQIYQTLINLSVNARDAMPNGGTLSFKTENLTLKDVIRQFPEATENKYCCLYVQDTGVGIDPGIIKRIFDPFFTTKEKGKGTGLGLAVVYGIIKSHKGYIDVKSEPGKGTQFSLFFPIPTAEKNITSTSDNLHETITGGTETLLLIEDEEALRGMVKTLLEMYGYTVITANDGEQALEVYHSQKDSINLIFSDMGLPKLTGEQFLYRLKEETQNFKLIFATGYIEPENKSALLIAGVQDILLKPYNPNQILRSIRTVLDRVPKPLS